ncbi:Gti1/Pac2 family-domain-containing protein [Gaertneriomyces semiglobifer]|nr:Gti1/Pac2 family-domain-containing protein [Gaertneriomyces semiglobifer]
MVEGNEASVIESCFGYVNTFRDSHAVIHAARIGLIPRLKCRPTSAQKNKIRSGSIIVYCEEEANITRWTDKRKWTPSRVRAKFLEYDECIEKIRKGDDQASQLRNQGQRTMLLNGRHAVLNSKGGYVLKLEENALTRRSTSILVNEQTWHLVSYYTKQDLTHGRLVRITATAILGHNFAAYEESYDVTVGVSLDGVPPGNGIGDLSLADRPCVSLHGDASALDTVSHIDCLPVDARSTENEHEEVCFGSTAANGYTHYPLGTSTSLEFSSNGSVPDLDFPESWGDSCGEAEWTLNCNSPAQLEMPGFFGLDIADALQEMGGSELTLHANSTATALLSSDPLLSTPSLVPQGVLLPVNETRKTDEGHQAMGVPMFDGGPLPSDPDPTDLFPHFRRLLIQTVQSRQVLKVAGQAKPNNHCDYIPLHEGVWSLPAELCRKCRKR